MRLSIRKFFHFQVKLTKTVINSLKCVQFLCSVELFIKCLKKGKKERKIIFLFISFIRYVYIIMNYFFFFMIDEATTYTRCRSYKKHKGDIMESWSDGDEE